MGQLFFWYLATVLGRRIDTVRIEDDAGGYCSLVEEPDIQDELDAVDCSTDRIRHRNLIDRELREVSIAISLAGLEAERRFHPEVDPGAAPTVTVPDRK